MALGSVYLCAVRVLIFHGYLLSGTGSNVYNASLARAMRGMGHEVHLVCQDRDARRSRLGGLRGRLGLGRASDPRGW